MRCTHSFPFTVAMSRSIVADPGVWGNCCGAGVHRQRRRSDAERGVWLKSRRRARARLRSGSGNGTLDEGYRRPGAARSGGSASWPRLVGAYVNGRATHRHDGALEVGVDVVREGLVADAGQAVEHGLEGHARDVQREVDGVQERDSSAERVPDDGNLLGAELGDGGLYGR